jgi:hypothetical protein
VPIRPARDEPLHFIHIECDEVLAAKRIEQALSPIANEWKVACRKKMRRTWANVGKHRLRPDRCTLIRGTIGTHPYKHHGLTC